jgi:hypothetical protein
MTSDSNVVAPETRDAGKITKARRKHRFANALLVLFCLLMVLSSVSIWVRNQINDTDRYMRTVGPLAGDPAIQEAIIVGVSDRFSSFLDEATLGDTLGDRQRYLAAPLKQLIENYVEDAVRAIVTSDQFPQIWIQANEIAHPRVSAILTGGSTTNMTTANGKITLDLTPLVDVVKDRLRDRGIDLFDRIPGDRLNPNIVIVDSPDLANIQGTIDRLEKLAWIFPFLALLALGGYIWLSTDRRQASIWAGLGLAITMVALMLLLSIGRKLYIDGLDSNVSRNAAVAFFDTIGRYFRDGIRLLAILGLLAAGIAVVTRHRKKGESVFTLIARHVSDAWHWVAVKWRRPETDSSWAERHLALIFGFMIVFCFAAVVWGDHTALGWAGTLALIIGLGAIATRLLNQSPPLQLSPSVTSGAILPTTIATDTTQYTVPTGSGAATEATIVALAQDLSPEDLKVLHRLAIGLRRTSQSTTNQQE